MKRIVVRVFTREKDLSFLPQGIAILVQNWMAVKESLRTNTSNKFFRI